MLVTTLQIELEVVLLKNVGIKKKRRRFVAGVVEGRILGEQVPERRLRVGKIRMCQRIPIAREIKQFVFQAELEFGAGVLAQEKINRLVTVNMPAEKLHEQKRGRYVGCRQR